MLGVCLLFVGIVLINNGVCTLFKTDGKSASTLNFMVGSLSIFINCVSLLREEYYAAGTGFLFGFTNIFIGLNYIFKLDKRPFAIFSVFVAVNAVIFGIVEGITGSSALGIEADWRWLCIWWLWAVLWGTSFFTDILKKDLKNFVPCLQIFEGIMTAWVPAVMMLLKIW